MKISDKTVVDVDYTLHLGDGEVVDRSEGEPLSYIQGAGQIVPGLEQALEGLEPGATKQVVVPPADGYGEHDARGVQEVQREAFPEGFEPKVGMQLVAEAPNGDPVQFTIRELRPSTILVDFNHPLAGRTLHFDVTIRGVRAATEEELEHGHAHGPGGHDHDHDHG
jgi:FKBP-type peptidyl-prolyl cis-trans isomerase SlyD